MENKAISIEVMGSGCPTCRKLFELTKMAVQEMGLNTEVQYVSDIQKILQLGFMQSPILAVNGRGVLAGFTSDMERIKKAIRSNL